MQWLIRLVLLPLLLALCLPLGGEPAQEPQTEAAEQTRLLCLVETQEEAQKIAEACGITLLEHQSGLAVFVTEEEPWSVIFRARELGYELSIDNEWELF